MLSASDERCYITAMVASGHAISSAGSSGAAAAGLTCCSLLDQQLLVNLLCTSQRFIRSCGQEWDVSLRDVKRCIKLARWAGLRPNLWRLTRHNSSINLLYLLS